jgi:hypothetical protein
MKTVCTFTLLALLFVACNSDANDDYTITIVNSSPQPIDSVAISAPITSFSFGAIPSGSTSTKPYKLTRPPSGKDGDQMFRALIYYQDTVINRLFGYYDNAISLRKHLKLEIDSQRVVNNRN